MTHIKTILHNKIEDVYMVEPNDLGDTRITEIYRSIAARFKVMPFIYVIPVAVVFTFFSYFLFGALIIKLATLLQYGF